MGDAPRPTVEVRKLFLLMLRRFYVANFVGAVLDYLFLQKILPASLRIPKPTNRDIEISAVVFVAYLVVIGALLFVRAGTAFTRQLTWAEDGRSPTPEQREVALRQPWVAARTGMLYWAIASVIFSVLNVIFGNPALVVVRIAVGILLGGLTTSALTFLLVERSLRPLFAVALAGTAPARQRYLGIRPRLMLSWALGSGVPLVAIATALVGKKPEADISTPVAFLAVVGLMGGWAIMYIAARSVADPLESVRGAVRRVEEGDLGVEVTVDDGGEVGLLQAGVNQMVAGLRERQRITELFGRHVGEEVARQALRDDAGLGGRTLVASVLFVDLIGSTALAQQRPPAEVVATLNALFDAVVRVVGAEGGWVNKFEGDGCLCVFGAPAPQPDHAARALRAARALHCELVGLAGRHSGLDAGIGVSSGPVVAGNVGTEERYEYTVIGDPVNEAARLVEEAKLQPTRVLASQASVEAAGAEGRSWSKVGELTLRGRAAPTCAYVPSG